MGRIGRALELQPLLRLLWMLHIVRTIAALSNPAEAGDVILGGGPVLCNSPIVVKKLNDRMVECAERIGIQTQREAASRLSYTDADQIHFSNQGVPTVLVSIPLRNMHTPAEVADMNDVSGCIELIAEFLSSYGK